MYNVFYEGTTLSDKINNSELAFERFEFSS